MRFFPNLLLLCISLLSFSATAQYTLREPSAIPLSGEWLFTLDPADAGEAGGWFRTDNPPARWDRATVPHCFSVDNRSLNFTGTAWYRRTFTWQPDPTKRVILHLDAAYYRATVWLNNRKIGTHEGGYTPFSFDISDALVAGENTLAISVNNDTWHSGTVPGSKDNGLVGDPFPGWLNYGGLIRPVYLTVEPLVYVDNLHVDAELDLTTGTATLRVKVRIRNTTTAPVSPKPILSVLFEGKPVLLRWQNDPATIAGQASGVWTSRAILSQTDVRLWSPDAPRLYTLRVALGSDTVSTRFGIRRVEVRNAQLLLNGQPIRMAGGNRVVDAPGLGSLEPDAVVEKDLRLMKEAGMELHRLTHYTPSETVLTWADEHGMLLISEAGNWQLTPRQMDDDSIRANFRRQFREMAERDWNHPSVIAYSVGNEYLSDTPSGQRWTRDLMAYARELDPARLVTFATMQLNKRPALPTDEASQYSDFVMTNTYGNHAATLDHIHGLYPDKPILISEYGQRADHPTGEAGQVAYLIKVLADIRARPYVVGASWWAVNDYQSRHYGTNPNGYRPWGLVQPDRSLRPLYAAHQREMAPLTVEKIAFTPGPAGQHQLRLRITARTDFPAYALLGYRLRVGAETLPIPDLQPGQSAELTLPVRGFPQTVLITVVKPTGFSILSQLIDLPYATR